MGGAKWLQQQLFTVSSDGTGTSSFCTDGGGNSQSADETKLRCAIPPNSYLLGPRHDQNSLHWIRRAGVDAIVYDVFPFGKWRITDLEKDRVLPWLMGAPPRESAEEVLRHDNAWRSLRPWPAGEADHGTVDGGQVQLSAGRRHAVATRLVTELWETRRAVIHGFNIVTADYFAKLSDRLTPAAEVRRRVESILDAVRLRDRIETPVPLLSGGEQQRVAVARALVIEPALLLFDEPLSNLDAKLREQMRFELKDLQRRTGIPILYVTHDQTEALAMSDRLAVMNAGRIVQIGTPDEIYSHPADRFVADFIGLMNFVPARIVERSGRIALEVTDAYLALQTARQQIIVGKSEVESAGSALTLAKERYRLGLASIVDVTTATTAHLAAEVRLSEAQFDVHGNALVLAFVIGESYKKF